ncbi:MAG: acyltransferase [Chitinophagaceae bacterium]|nr:MAG: acyltransferase [Chitinophagaceae bacterium]
MKGFFLFALYLRKVIGYVWAKTSNLIVLRTSNIIYPPSFVINGNLSIIGKGKIKVGNNVIINSGIKKNPVGLATKTILFCYPNATISMGNNIGISNSLLCAMNSIIIEDNVRIGGGTQILDNDFHSLYLPQRLSNPDPDIKSKPVLIKAGAFIGCNSIILKGVTIGERSVIAAGSVVTKSIPADEIWGGNPAHFIKSLLTDERNR